MKEYEIVLQDGLGDETVDCAPDGDSLLTAFHAKFRRFRERIDRVFQVIETW